MWPKDIGAKVRIDAVDANRYLEDGFWPEECSGGRLTMRRDFHSGMLLRNNSVPSLMML